MNLKPYSSLTLSLAGLTLACIGLYFIFVRPPLLTEDLRYIGISSQKINSSIPGLLNWLHKVFLVMGTYIFTVGLLIIYISRTSFLMRLPGSFAIVILAGISSIGVMTAVNFVISSDFKWVLLLFNLPWVTALILYRFHK